MLTLILSTSLFTYDIFPPGDPKLTQSPQPEKELIIYQENTCSLSNPFC